jgi:tagatose-1,6-bisphosphate aldolase
MSEIIYELKQQIEYAHGGEKEQASFIVLTAPGYEQMRDFVTIKQALLAAINSVSDNSGEAEKPDTDETEEKASKATGSDYVKLLYLWKGDLQPVMQAAKRMLTSGVATVEGAEPLTVPLLKKISMVDFEGLVGEYLANFIVPSLTDGA